LKFYILKSILFVEANIKHLEEHCKFSCVEWWLALLYL